jgi:hypothetical protein
MSDVCRSRADPPVPSSSLSLQRSHGLGVQRLTFSPRERRSYQRVRLAVGSSGLLLLGRTEAPSNDGRARRFGVDLLLLLPTLRFHTARPLLSRSTSLLLLASRRPALHLAKGDLGLLLLLHEQHLTLVLDLELQLLKIICLCLLECAERVGPDVGIGRDGERTRTRCRPQALQHVSAVAGWGALVRGERRRTVTSVGGVDVGHVGRAEGGLLLGRRDVSPFALSLRALVTYCSDARLKCIGLFRPGKATIAGVVRPANELRVLLAAERSGESRAGGERETKAGKVGGGIRVQRARRCKRPRALWEETGAETRSERREGNLERAPAPVAGASQLPCLAHHTNHSETKQVTIYSQDEGFPIPFSFFTWVNAPSANHDELASSTFARALLGSISSRPVGK